MNKQTINHHSTNKAIKSPAIKPSAPKSPEAKVSKANDSKTASTQATAKTSLTLALTVTASIIAMGYYFLVVQNSDTLFMAQNKSFSPPTSHSSSNA
ncbi:MAG: hypothetical protein Q4P12_00520 [Bacteroidales bacterium]|nr:hypothetical protein [Bacteroidales bacterium]